MIYIYTDGSGKYNCICDGLIRAHPSTKVRTDKFGNQQEYVSFDVLYNYDIRNKRYMSVHCMALNQPTVRLCKYLRVKHRVLIFGTIFVNKRQSTETGKIEYTLLVSSFIPLNEMYSLMEKAHEGDTFEARIMSQYKKKKKRKPSEIDFIGEADKILSEQDVLL